MKYNVHRYEVYRARIDTIEADSPAEAVEKAGGVPPEEFEFAEDYTGFLVDEVGDEDFEKSQFIYPNGTVDVGQRLYLVAFTYDDNYDMLVWARSRQEAVNFWEQNWVDHFDRPFQPDNVFLIPTEPQEPGPIPWGSMLES